MFYTRSGINDVLLVESDTVVTAAPIEVGGGINRSLRFVPQLDTRRVVCSGALCALWRVRGRAQRRGAEAALSWFLLGARVAFVVTMDAEAQ